MIYIKKTHRLCSFASWLSDPMKTSTALCTSSASAVGILGEEKECMLGKGKETQGQARRDFVALQRNNLYPQCGLKSLG